MIDRIDRAESPCPGPSTFANCCIRPPLRFSSLFSLSPSLSFCFVCLFALRFCILGSSSQRWPCSRLVPPPPEPSPIVWLAAWTLIDEARERREEEAKGERRLVTATVDRWIGGHSSSTPTPSWKGVQHQQQRLWARRCRCLCRRRCIRGTVGSSVTWPAAVSGAVAAVR